MNDGRSFFYGPAQPAFPFGKGDEMVAVQQAYVKLVTEIIIIRCHGRKTQPVPATIERLVTETNIKGLRRKRVRLDV